MSIRALFSTFYLMLMAGCVVRAQSPDAAPPDSAPAPDTFVECKADGPVVICNPLDPQESQNEICDPVCQTGCNWCNSGKCTYGYKGIIYCGLKQKTDSLKGLMEPCNVSGGQNNQIDDCAPGLVCLRPVDGEISSYCFRPCRIPAFDCNQGDSQYECADRPLAPKFFDEDSVKVKACNPSPSLNCKNSNCCDPTKDRGPGNANCTVDQVCRLLNIDKDGINSRTTCDLGTGVGLKYADCKTNLDCGSGFSCIKGKCRQVCDRNVDPEKNFCAPFVKCAPHGAQYGYCDP